MEVSDVYKIISPLGKNQGRKFGSLFLAEHKTTNEKAVLKAVQKSNKAAVAIERLKAESTFSFDFTGLPKILDVFESENEMIIVRNYVEADTIDNRFAKMKRRNRHAFLCDALEKLGVLLNHLHERGIYHCDIKPGNILIDTEEQVHLIDFGLSLKNPQQAERKLLFPLGYAAPELLLNQLDLVDHRTDYFALGIAIWRMYAGKLPLTHPNPSIFTNLQLTHPLPESYEIPKKVQKVLEKMCVKHTFRLPPNKMKSIDVHPLLESAMQSRYKNYESFLSDFKSAKRQGFFTKRYRDGSQG
jgi:serine/threonine protein kinase